MTKGSDFRDAVVDALRRDLMGPLADPTGCYPTGKPRCIDVVSGVNDQKDLQGLLLHEDGQELLPYPPTSRYGVGILFPKLNVESERQLDEEQNTGQGDSSDEELSEESELTILPEGQELRVEAEESSEDPTINRSPRPSSMGLSFVVTGADHLDVRLDAARYETLKIRAGGTNRDLWHRVHLHAEPLRFEISNRAGSSTEQDIEFGPIRVRVGCFIRQSERRGQIVTCYVRNVTPPPLGDEFPASKCLFQVELRVELAAGQLRAYPNVSTFLDVEDATLSLLYRDSPVRAVGHGCDAVAEDTLSGHTVKTQAFPTVEVRATSTITRDSDNTEISVGMRALANWDDTAISSIELLIKSYGAWIHDQHTMAAGLPEQSAATASRHLAQCETFLSDITEGWETAKSNADVRQCLRWTSQAMAEQQCSYQAATRTIAQTEAGLRISPPTRTLVNEPVWRGFQVAFLLASIGPAIDSAHPCRTSLDVIWMPTGGGKTEAYLGLAAFTMLWRRLHSEDKDDYNVGDTTVLMRYTLRLLTAQQLQRTASLICALECIRKKEDRLGKRRFTVGAWLGSASTPNTHDGEYGSVKRLKTYMKYKKGDRPFLLSRCPWCACQFVDDDKNVYGYDVQSLKTGGTRMRAKCPDPCCPFSIKENGTGAGLPVYEVDEDLYEHPPTFIIATVDKFAMLAWRDDPRAFFGIGKDGKRTRIGPDVIIQDELHLITGPLGSLVGLYEAGIAALCKHDGGQPPQFVAATATTRAYESQAKKVFSVQGVRLVPPPALSITDSFFSHVDETTPPRVHVGICATGLGQFTRTQARVFASLTHAVGSLSRTEDQVADYYWSNLAFFGSLRDLGTAKSLSVTDLKAYQWNLVRATGVTSGPIKNNRQRSTRYLGSIIELTGNSSQSASENLERLERSSSEKGCIDLALATSVIEVGVDISRLGLLTIVRQPKTVGTYIQVSGRVGRRANDGPGLVVVILNPQAGRDTSHYERFTAFHDRLYETVEPATVTPFTDASLERGIRGVMASVVRQLRPAGDAVISAEDIELSNAIVDSLANRAAILENSAAAARVRERWAFAASQLSAALSEKLRWGTAFSERKQFLHITGDSRNEDLEDASWSVLTSLRNVDATAGTRISADWIRTAPGLASSIVALTKEPTLEGQEEAEW